MKDGVVVFRVALRKKRTGKHERYCEYDMSNVVPLEHSPDLL